MTGDSYSTTDGEAEGAGRACNQTRPCRDRFDLREIRAQLPDLWISELKALIFGFIAGIVAAYRGLNPAGGPKGVGDAVNQAVVITFLLLFFVNFVLTTIYLQVVPAKGS